MVSFNPAITEKLNALSENVLNGHYIFSRDFDESYLAKRYAKADVWPHNVSYGLTTDKKLIDQYYKVRLEAYHAIIGDDFYAGKDEFDDNCQVYIAKAGNNCIGGVRLTISSPAASKRLPMEIGEFSIKEHFKDLDLNNITYCEASRLAMLPEFRNNGHIWDQLQVNSTNYLINEMGMEIGFGQSGVLQTRRFKSQFRDMGYELIVHKNIKTPDAALHEYLNVQFWSIDFTPDRKYTDILKSHSRNAEAAKEQEFA